MRHAERMPMVIFQNRTDGSRYIRIRASILPIPVRYARKFDSCLIWKIWREKPLPYRLTCESEFQRLQYLEIKAMNDKSHPIFPYRLSRIDLALIQLRIFLYEVKWFLMIPIYTAQAAWNALTIEVQIGNWKWTWTKREGR